MNAVIIYEIGQVPELIALYERNKSDDTYSIVALGADIEFALRDAGIPYISGRDLRPQTPPFLAKEAARRGKELLAQSALSFFTYQGISLGDIYTVALQDYVVRLLYFINAADALLKRHPEISAVHILQTTIGVSPTSGLLARFEAPVATDAFTLVCAQRQIPCSIIPVPPALAPTHSAMRTIRPILVDLLSNFYTFLATVGSPRRPLRILASEQWRNIAPLMGALPDAELLLLDRGQSQVMGASARRAHRTQLLHFGEYIRSKELAAVEQARNDFAATWDEEGMESRMQYGDFNGYDLAPQLSHVISHIIITGGAQAARLIESMRRLMQTRKPHLVLVRASVSAQPHFALLCLVAKSLGIPALELQHGIFYLGEGSFSRVRFASHIADYGPQSHEELKAIGFTEEQLLSVGSPRFDRYERFKDAARTFPTSGPRIGCIVPEVLTGSWNDTYDVQDFLTGFAQAVRQIPGAHAVLKSRPSEVSRAFYERIIQDVFNGISTTVLRYEPMEKFFEESDIIVTCYSTAVLEVLICGVPLVYDASVSMQAELGESLLPYAVQGALLYAHTRAELQAQVKTVLSDPELFEELSRKSRIFMESKYRFDGGASKRLADAIHTLASHKKIS